MDLEASSRSRSTSDVPAYTLEWFDDEASTRGPPHATVWIAAPEGRPVRGAVIGDGPVDAIFKAVGAVTRREANLREFPVRGVTAGKDAQGEASVKLELSGSTRPARASRPTSSRRRPWPTCARCPTSSARS